jgi:hypothetical protein
LSISAALLRLSRVLDWATREAACILLLSRMPKTAIPAAITPQAAVCTVLVHFGCGKAS